jgi:hypothetical protein
MARTLAEAANGEISAETAAAKIVADPASSGIVDELAGKQFPVNNTLLSFGSGNQFGDIAFRDVAGRDIVNIQTGLQKPFRQKRPRVLLASIITAIAILTLGGISVASYFRQNPPPEQSPNTSLPTNITQTHIINFAPSLSPLPTPFLTATSIAVVSSSFRGDRVY